MQLFLAIRCAGQNMNLTTSWSEANEYSLINKTSAKAFCKINNIRYYTVTNPVHENIIGISTYVHEAYHNFNIGFINKGDANAIFFMDSIQTIRLKYNFLITSDVILPFLDPMLVNDPDVKAYLKEDNFAKNNGIFGLMEEFSAYAHQAQFVGEVYCLLDSSVFDRSIFVENYIRHIDYLEAKYYKFCIFIKTYYQVVSKKNNNFYSFLTNDSAFLLLESTLQSLYQNSLNKLVTVRAKLILTLTKSIPENEVKKYMKSKDADLFKDILKRLN